MGPSLNMQPNIPTRTNNPGDLKDPSTGSFKQFSDPKEGYAALLNDLHSKQMGTTTTGLGPSSTLADFAKTYAPESDNNNSAKYAADLANQMGVRPDSQLKELDLGKWADAVAKNEGYQSSNTQEPAAQGPAVTAPQENLGQKLAARLVDVSNSISQGGAGQISAPSAALQSVGSVAGGVGDVVNSAMNLVPGVPQLEEGFGNIVGSLANTSVGQSVVQAGMDFANAHPEIAGDLGAVLNIASVLPMFKGLSLFKGAAADAISSTFENRLAGVATKELTDVSSKTITGRNLVDAATKRGLNPIATIIGKAGARFLPDVSVGADGIARYSTPDAYANLGSSLAGDEMHMETMLKASHDSAGISLDQVRKETIAMAKKELQGNPDFPKIVAKINTDFDGIKESLGGRSYTDVKDLNDIKRMVRSSVNFKSDNLDENSRYLIGQAMMKKIEETAEKNGIAGVRELNKKMASKIEAMKVLKHLNGKVLKGAKPQGIIRQGIAGALTAGGEAAGNSVGLPFAGALIGRGASGLVHKAPGAAMKSLSRIGSSGGIAKAATKGLLRTATPGLTQAALKK